MMIGISSCEKEEDDVVLNTANSFTKSAPVVPLILRVAQNETACDNVLDNTSAFSVQLPVHLTINNQYVSVASAAGYSTVQNIKNQYTTDDDVVHFAFPIIITYRNYQQVVVANQQQFDVIFAQCSTDSGLTEITCIDFNYPFTISMYNSENQVSSTVVIQNNAQLYNFIYNLQNGQIVGIVFPLQLTKSNGQSINVNTNPELEQAIESVINNCNTVTPLVLSDVLTSGTWHISYCNYNNVDETSNYVGYDFTFLSNGSSKATKNGITTYGYWDIHNENNYQRLDLDFDTGQLHNIENQWKVQEYTASLIRLKYEYSGSYYYLNFIKN